MAATVDNGPIYPPIDPEAHAHKWQCPGVLAVPGPGGLSAVLFPLYCQCGDIRLRLSPEPEAPPDVHRRQILAGGKPPRDLRARG